MKHKSASTDLCTSGDKSLSNWDEAIGRAKKRMAEIRRSIRGMEELRDQGMSFPSLKERKARSSSLNTN